MLDADRPFAVGPAHQVGDLEQQYSAEVAQHAFATGPHALRQSGDECEGLPEQSGLSGVEVQERHVAVAAQPRELLVEGLSVGQAVEKFRGDVEQVRISCRAAGVDQARHSGRQHQQVVFRKLRPVAGPRETDRTPVAQQHVESVADSFRPGFSQYSVIDSAVFEPLVSLVRVWSCGCEARMVHQVRFLTCKISHCFVFDEYGSSFLAVKSEK